jgi:nucleotide-binding universal stress UspA family protein
MHHAYGGDPIPALEALEADEREIFAKATAEIEAAKLRDVEANTMGTHARRGLARLFLGSTAAAVLHATDRPTFVVHEESANEPAPSPQILVALDGSPAASIAARVAIDLAAHDDGSAFFVHVAERDDDAGEDVWFGEARSYALASGVPHDSALLHGDPVAAILIGAETCHAKLIALGAHDRAAPRFGMGSVAEAIVRSSRVPVLVVPIAATSRPSLVSPVHEADVSAT